VRAAAFYPRQVSAALLVAGLAGVGPPAVRAQSAGPVPKPRLDSYGDPLPDGAISRFGTVRFRNLGDGPIAFAPGGRHFATDRNGLSLMDLATGELVRRFATNGPTRRISFSPDGKRLLTHNDGDAAESIWDVESGKKVRSIEGGGGVFVRDGKALVQVERIDNGTTDVRVVDVAGKKLAGFRLRRKQHFWAVSPTGNHVAFAYENRMVVVDLGRGEELDFGDVSAVVGNFRGCVFAPVGKNLIVAGGTAVALWDVETGKEIRVWKGARSDSPPVVSPDGKRVAWSGYHNDLGISYPWAVDVDGDKPWRVGAPTNSFTAPAFTHDGNQLAVFDDGGAMQLRDVVTGKEVRPVAAHGGVVGGIKFTADGKYLITSDKNCVLVWDRATARLLRRYPEDLPDGERLLNTVTKTRSHIITLDRTDVLRLRDLVTGEGVLRLEGEHGFIGGGASPASVSVDGGSAAIVDKEGDIRVYDLKSGKVRFTFDPEAAVWSADLSADGRFLQVSTQGRKRSDRFIVDTKSGKEVAPDSLHPPESKHLGEPGEGRLHQVGFETMNWLAGQRLLDAAGQPLELDGAFSGAQIYSPANARYIAVHTFRGRKMADDDEPGVRIRIWDAETKKLLTHFNPQKILPEHGLFSPDGRTMVVVGHGVISAWEVATGRERARFKGHFSSVSAVRFTPDGHGLVTGGADSQVLLWDYTGRCRDGVWSAAKHAPERQGTLWKSLASEDAGEAHRAIWELIADPEGTSKFLDEKLQAAKAPDAALLSSCIDRLSAPAFADREKAASELGAFGDAILTQLRSARGKAADAELRERLDRLIRELERPAVAGGRLQQVRAVEVLEALGTAASRRVLEKLAGGAAGASLTREARFGLGR
jgi:WD40 repeat protein